MGFQSFGRLSAEKKFESRAHNLRSIAFLLVRSFALAIVASYHAYGITDNRPTVKTKSTELRKVGKLFAKDWSCYQFPSSPTAPFLRVHDRSPIL
jgi:hypothetical protein